MRASKIVSSIFAAVFFLLSGKAFADATTAPLVQMADLQYIGAFRLASNGSSDFSYSNDGMAYNAANNSLFVKCNLANQHVAEINIPTLVNSSDINALNSASIRQNCADITEGNMNPQNLGNGMILGGLLVHGNKLIGAEYAYYDGSHEQTTSHFAHSLTVNQTGTYQGQYALAVSPLFPGYVAGHMSPIPVEWQSLLGYPALTGSCCHAIVDRQSMGPSIWGFDPANLGAQSPVPTTPFVYYNLTHPTLGGWVSSGPPNPEYNLATAITGVVFPPGTRSVLFFGSTGLGAPCYGGTTQSGTGPCNDPVYPNDYGSHAYPYAYYVWMYDANDFLAVKNGTKTPWEVIPYYSGQLSSLHFATGENKLNGAVYDPATKRIYISQYHSDGTQPVISVLQVNTATASTYTVTPSAGANGTISPNTAQTVNSGSTAQFTVTANAGFTASVGGTCGGSLVGTTYTTNAITGNCTVAAAFADTEVPTAPTYMDAYSASTASVVLKWQPSTDNAGVALYRVDYCAGYNCTNYATLGTTAATTLTHSGIAASSDPQIYRYRVRAEDAAGNASAYAASIRYNANPTVPAFPGAQGSGATSKGGRGGTIYRVTSLAASGAGTLRECVQATGPRTCVFAVAGTINLTSSLVIGAAYITIAGNTAPGGGITLAGTGMTGDLFSVQTHDVIVRNIRFRHGDNAGQVYNDGDSLNVISLNNVAGPVNRIIFDHITSSWALDENLGIWSNTPVIVRDVSIGNSMLYEPLGPYFLNFLVGAATSDKADQSVGIDLFRSLLTQSSYRNPMMKAKEIRIASNLFGNWRYSATSTIGGVNADIIGNVYRNGSLRAGNLPYEIFVAPPAAAGTATGTTSVYTVGNKGYHNPDPANDDWGMVWEVTGEGKVDEWQVPGVSPVGVLPLSYRRMIPLPASMWPISAVPASALEASLLPVVGAARRLDCAGNWVDMRDAQDARIVSEYANDTGSATLLDSEATVGGFPTLAAGTACTDTDGDGMPDTWETANGLNPASAADGPTIHASGYSNLERFLAGVGDFVAPVLSGFGPASPLATGTTSTMLALTTDEPATCRYSSSSGAEYIAMTAFSATGGTAHSTTVATAKGRTDWYYLRCQDASGNLSAQAVHRLSVADSPKRRGSR